MAGISWDLLARQKATQAQIEKNTIYLNNRTKLDVSNPIKPVHFLIAGESGSGKTTLALIILDQSEAAIFLDPKGQCEKTLKELGSEKDWKFYKIVNSPRVKNYEPFKLNVREFTTEVVTTLSWRKAGGIDLGVRQKLYQFFKQPETSNQKTYEELKKTCKKNKRLRLVFEEIEQVFDKNDNGTPLTQLMQQKSVLDLVGFDPENKALPMIARQILATRQSNWQLTRQKFYFGIDEGQDIATRVTNSGYAIGQIFSQGRSFNVVGVISTNVIGQLHPNIKNNAFIQCIFESSFDKRKFEKLYGIDLEEEVLTAKLEKLKEENEYGNCVLHNRHDSTVKAIHADYHYKQLRQRATAKVIMKTIPIANRKWGLFI